MQRGFIAARVQEAYGRIREHVIATPLTRSTGLSAESGRDVWLKLENQQHTGSFKVRGAFAKLLALGAEGRRNGVIAASSGNHGAAVAYAAARLGDAPATIIVPEGASPAKVAAIRRYGARMITHGGESGASEAYARSLAATERRPYVSPYNDIDVIAGQGTMAVEIVGALPGLGSRDTVFVAVGGGGLASGVAGYLRMAAPETRIIGCSPEASAAMLASVRAGRVVDVPHHETLSDGTAGGIEDGTITLEPCARWLDDIVTVSEPEIGRALRDLIELDHQLVEGAAAVTLAALRRHGAGGRAILVLCGANISVPTLRRALDGPAARNAEF